MCCVVMMNDPNEDSCHEAAQCPSSPKDFNRSQVRKTIINHFKVFARYNSLRLGENRSSNPHEALDCTCRWLSLVSPCPPAVAVRYYQNVIEWFGKNYIKCLFTILTAGLKEKDAKMLALRLRLPPI